VIAEAIDTVWTLGVAFLVWIVLCAVFATLALYAVAVTVAFACRAMRRGVTACVAAVQRSPVPESPPEPHKPAEARTRPVPSWARTQPHDTEEAA
jgi:hypothetical protein